MQDCRNETPARLEHGLDIAARVSEYRDVIFMISVVLFMAAFIFAVVRGQLLKAKKIVCI